MPMILPLLVGGRRTPEGVVAVPGALDKVIPIHVGKDVLFHVEPVWGLGFGV